MVVEIFVKISVAVLPVVLYHILAFFVALMGMQVAQCGDRPVIVLLSSQKRMAVT